MLLVWCGTSSIAPDFFRLLHLMQILSPPQFFLFPQLWVSLLLERLYLFFKRRNEINERLVSPPLRLNFPAAVNDCRMVSATYEASNSQSRQ